MGVPLNRVVAIVAVFANGEEQVGSGFLIEAGKVLTAEHCTRRRKTGEPATSIKIVKINDYPARASIPVVADKILASQHLDVAIVIIRNPPWEQSLPRLEFIRVHRSESKVLKNCEGIGFPSWQVDPEGVFRTGEFHGTSYVTDEASTGRFLVREDLIRFGDRFEPQEPETLFNNPTSVPRYSRRSFSERWRPWGGFSGTLLFYQGKALGVVVEHRPQQGQASMRLLPFDTIVSDPTAGEITKALGLNGLTDLSEETGNDIEPLDGLVEKLDLADNDLPRLLDMTPYQLGSTPTQYARESGRQRQDPYVPRTANDVDAQLREALEPGHIVLVVGPSKAGKTRTAFEAIRARWTDSRVVIPVPHKLSTLVRHPRIRTSKDPLVIWMDDFQQYLLGGQDPFTQAVFTSMQARQGPTLVVCTLRSEVYAHIIQDAELAPSTQRVLSGVTEIRLAHTNQDVTEQKAAQDAYPQEQLSTNGLGEQLSGGTFLVRLYQGSPPMLRLIIQTAIDWTRIGMIAPIPESKLIALASEQLLDDSPGAVGELKTIENQIEIARTPPKNGGAGQVAALFTEVLSDRTLAYRPFSYLVAADEGQIGPSRPIPDKFWERVLVSADADEAMSIGISANQRNNNFVAIRSLYRAARAGNATAMFTLGHLSEEANPPLLERANSWYLEAARAGHVDAMYNLGLLLAQQGDPTTWTDARYWFEQAAEAGSTEAMFNLALLLQNASPPQTEESWFWLEQAAQRGDIEAMNNLGNLLVSEIQPVDLDSACLWFRKAAQAGHIEGMFNLGILLTQLEPPQLQEAATWFEQAAENGHANSMFNLGVLLMQRNDPQHFAKAWHWFEQAAQAGHLDAMLNLGIFLKRECGPEYLTVAYFWLKKAAQHGHVRAMLNLAVLCAEMSPPRIEESNFWYEKALKSEQ